MKKIHFTLFLLLLSVLGSSQVYFQQEVNYVINVKLDDVRNELSADESIEYINNSPHTLGYIYMHLWPNAYKDNNTALAKQKRENGETNLYFSKEEERGYIDMLDFKVDGKSVKWETLKDSIDICKIYLNEPLNSGSKITITTPFHVKLPSGEFSRLGHIGQSYQITQWYPKPAVFDRNGWNQMPYLNQGEFYSEFGSFDVSITLPKNYVLGATGDMVNGEEELKWLQTKVEETQAIEYYDTKDLSFPKSDSLTKTLRFKQSNVHDFAWFCDKRYHVLKGEVTTPHTKHVVTTWVMFTNKEGNLWKKSIPYMNDAIHYYSLWNGDYPYNHCTAVDGTISAGGGMEYPNITVIGASGSDFQLDVVITHEVGHNWFYGMLGSNEREHPWMDEGLNSANELRYVETKYPGRKLTEDFIAIIGKALHINSFPQKFQYYLSYFLPAAVNEDQPIETAAHKYTELNYGGVVYSKSAISFDYLKKYLGDEVYDAAMQKYFNEWHFKHPMPDDLRKIFERETGKDLGWFFNDLIKTTKKLDYKIAFAKQRNDGAWDIGVKNKGQVKGPVVIYGLKDDKIVGEVMYDGFEKKALLGFPSAEVDKFKIDQNENMPEINRNNNTIRTRGLFKKMEPVKLQLLGSIDHPDKTQIYYTPVVGWNNYNKWMFGLAFYNNLFPEKKYEYQIMPMYSHSTKSFTGYGHAALNFFPKNSAVFQKISIGGTFTRYAYSNKPFDLFFNKISEEVNIEFKKKIARSPYTHSVNIRPYILILKDDYRYNISVDSFGSSYTTEKKSVTESYSDLTYKFSKRDAITPYDVSLNLQNGFFMTKASITANYSYKFKNKNKSFDVRFFAGSFIGPMTSAAGAYRFRMSGWRGYQDYLYDNIYLGRTETDGILANQFTENEGAFKFYSPVGQSAKWLTALNLKSTLGNMKIPLALYADIGTCDNDGLITDKILYDAGVCLTLRKNIFEVYFPVLICNDFQKYKDANDLQYVETIRFTLNINLLNPFNLAKNFSL
ncbi:MAG: hypothetical protein K0Q95_93 [Bacteroidota bacterium]|jgi:hypothetical protein|nr:hypothetical protein [Bacteroidota bacterium]